jgi:bifunctional non-homologous end joining protein LigD
MPQKREIDLVGRNVQVSNIDKVLYPEAGFTKGDVLNYYIGVSQYLLPHLKDRPVTLKRFPDGIAGKFFYEKNAPASTPKWVKTFPVPRRAGGKDICYIVIDDLPSLVWCANRASLELHPFLHRAPRIDRPTSIVFDLDPGEGVDILQCIEVAFLLKDLLGRWDLQTLPKVSGSKGLQLYLPLNTAVTYGATRPFAKAVAQFLAVNHPTLVVAEMAKTERKQRVFIDWSQNSDFKTTVGVYSLRAKQQYPFVSLPVTWDELEHAWKSKTHDGLYYQPGAALERLEQMGDLFAPVLKLKQHLHSDLLAQLTAKPVRFKGPDPNHSGEREHQAWSEK